MAKTSIEWTSTVGTDGTRHPGYTFNPWWGCVKVSPACANCYAESFSKRYGHDVWGKNAPRRFFGDEHWHGPVKWDAKAEHLGVRLKVFCASMADVFEDRPELVAPRARLLELIEATPNLDWLLLTKRPESVIDELEQVYRQSTGKAKSIASLWMRGFPPLNVWLGTTVENQDMLKRAAALQRVPAMKRFLSCEPLLELIDFNECEDEGDDEGNGAVYYNMLSGYRWMRDGFEKELDSTPGINWVIAGGESGYGARPMHPAWVRALRDQCQLAGVPFFFKQWGMSAPSKHPGDVSFRLSVAGKDVTANASAWQDDDMWMRQYRTKHDAGRELDGRVWDDMPVTMPGRI